MAREPQTRASLRERWADRLLGSDPGLGRLLLALDHMLTFAAGIGAMWLLLHFTGALQLPAHGPGVSAAEAALAMADNHLMLVTAMLVATLGTQTVVFAMSDSRVTGQLVSALHVAAALVPVMALGLALGGYRVLGLAVFAVLLGAGAYLRRFGPRWSVVGMVLFFGYMVGYLMHGEIAWSGFGWLAAEGVTGVAAGALVHLLFFGPRHHRALRRFRQSYAARARKAARLTLAVFDQPDGPASRRLHRQIARLNEAALIIDGSLSAPGALPPGESAAGVHALIFDIELALTNIARFADALGRLQLPAPQDDAIRRVLESVADRDLPAAKAAAAELAEPGRDGGRPDAVTLHRFAASVADLADALAGWRTAGDDTPGGARDAAYNSPVHVALGRLPGAAQVSARASTEAGRHPATASASTRPPGPPSRAPWPPPSRSRPATP